MIQRNIFIFFFLASIVITSCRDNSILNIEGGQIQGVQSGTEGVTVYRGIPYAAAPVGDLRWKEPQPVTPWEGVKIADKFGNAAYQAAHQEGEFYQKEFFWEGDAPYSEDCLYLNVWAPDPGKKSKNLPVAMWIHGGGYMAGWSFEPEMDGEAWAERGVILVTINYRLGIFGFLAHPELSVESPHQVSGNYGILDQIAALKWIVNNISQFGGDPENITIFGQSAGAGSVQTLVASPLSKDIPAKAIIQSGGGISERPIMRNMKLAEAEETGKTIMDWAGYEDLQQMRAASTEDIFSAFQNYMRETSQFMMLSPIIDDYVLSEDFSSAALGGRISDIPYMIGSTKDDMGGLGSGDAIGKFCISREEMNGKAYAYQFARPLPGDESGAFHSSELWYIFHTLKRSWRPFTEGDNDLSNVMVDAWTNFARSGDPNDANNEKWTPFTKENPNYMIFKLDEDGKEASAMGQPLEPMPGNTQFPGQ
jgi:para-nitrobenzyl esterase